MNTEELRKDDMMAHLMDSLDAGEDIGHYGRLVFVMVGHHFLTDDELVSWLCKDKSCDENDARAMVMSVKSKNYNPPKREKILQFQKQQDFPICPSSDPDACNVYRNLKFPQEVYEHIQQYQIEKAEAQMDQE
ncbi:MAG TPA: hypothetical protein VF669_06450 [Tepidisphaeraceae bacterium]|jgi:hypothetical protein